MGVDLSSLVSIGRGCYSVVIGVFLFFVFGKPTLASPSVQYGAGFQIKLCAGKKQNKANTKQNECTYVGYTQNPTCMDGSLYIV